jgi:predicted RNase H-like nuclease (RuvC/YqgF family)
LQEKLRDLQSKLQTEEEQRTSFQSKYEEANQTMNDVRRELEAANQRLTSVEELEKAAGDARAAEAGLKQELDSLKEALKAKEADSGAAAEVSEISPCVRSVSCCSRISTFYIEKSKY